MPDFVDIAPMWTYINRKILLGESTLAVAPRYYGKQAILRELARRHAVDGDVSPIVISSADYVSAGVVDYRSLWGATRRQLESNLRSRPKDRYSYRSAFDKIMAQQTQPILVCIDGPGRTCEVPYIEILNLFNDMLTEYRTGLVVVATDDFSLYFYERDEDVSSARANLPAKIFGPLDKQEIEHLVKAASKSTAEAPLSAAQISDLAAGIRDLSGGHCGLIGEILDKLLRSSWELLPESWGETSSLLKHSGILTRLSRFLKKDAIQLTEIALRFEEPDFFDPRDDGIDLLREMGILHETTMTQIQLCPGAITTMVKRLHEWALTRNGVRRASPDHAPEVISAREVELTDDDLVVLHLSDLHVGADSYAFRFEVDGEIRNKQQPALESLIRSDLKELKLFGRVDALVISGDFVWNGQHPEEFRCARRVIERLLEALELEKDRLLIIPGNHDVGWDRRELQAQGIHEKVTRGNYDDFVELLYGKPKKTPHMVSLLSRSGNSELRIVGIESNAVEHREAAGIGYVLPNDLFEKARALIESPCEATTENVAAWLVVHHHVIPATASTIEQAAQKQISVMANASQILTLAAHWGIELIMHGHEHQPSLTVARRWPIRIGGGMAPVVCAGAGSCGASKHLGPIETNQYSIVIRQNQSITMLSRWFDKMLSEFTEHETILLHGVTSAVKNTKPTQSSDGASGN